MSDESPLRSASPGDRGFGFGAGFGSPNKGTVQTLGVGRKSPSGGKGPSTRSRPMSADRARPGSGHSAIGNVTSQRSGWQKTPTVTTGSDGVERINVRPTSAPPERPNRRNLDASLPYSDNFLDRKGEPVDVALARFQLLSLPDKGKCRSQLRTLIAEEAKHHRCKRADRLLATARGQYGDWRSSRARDLSCLIQALADGGRHAEMTRVLSDPQFLQRRLRLGTLSELLIDFEVCERALEELIASEPIHKRSAESSAALSRRMYVSSLRHHLKGHAKKMNGHNSLHFFSSLAKSQFASIVHPLVTSLLAFVGQHEAFYSARMRANNRPVELWLPLQENANVAMLQSDPTWADSLAKELLVAVSVAPSRLKVRFESNDDLSQPSAGYAVVGVSTLIEAMGLWSVRVAEQIRQYLMLPWSELCHGPWASILDVSSIREYCEVVDADTAGQDVANALEVRERLQHAQDSGLVQCLNEGQAQRIRSLWRYTEEVLGLYGGGTAQHNGSKGEMFGYELVIGALWGYAAPGTHIFRELGSSVADACGVGVEEVSVQTLHAATSPALSIRVLVLLPSKDLHRPAKIHKAWQARFQVSEGPSPVRRAVWWWFSHPLSHDLRDAELSSLVNESLALKGHGAASVQVQLSQLRKWVRAELPTELPVVLDGARIMDTLQDRLFETNGRILTGQPAINDLVAASQAGGREREEWEVSPDGLEWFVGETVEQERVLDHHLQHFSRKESRERLLIQLQALCHYHRVSHSAQADMADDSSRERTGSRVVVVEGGSGSGRTALMCRLAKDLALLGKMGVVVGLRRPGQGLESLMEYVAMDLGLQMFGRTFADSDLETDDLPPSWTESGRPVPAVLILDGLNSTELGTALKAVFDSTSDASEAERVQDRHGWSSRLRLARRGVQGGLTVVVTTDKAEAACRCVLESVPADGVSVLQVEPMSIAEQRTLLRSHAQGIGAGMVGGGASHALKALEEVVSSHAHIVALPGAKAVGDLTPLSPLFLACATRYVMGSGGSGSRVVDDGFPRGVSELLCRLLQHQERSHGSEAVVAAVEPFLWEGQGVQADEACSGLPARLRPAAGAVLGGISSLFFPPYASSSKLAEAAEVRHAPVNEAARRVLQQYVRQATKQAGGEEGSEGSKLAGLGLRSLDAVEEFLRQAEAPPHAVASQSLMTASVGQLAIDRVQSRSVLVSWTARMPPIKGGVANTERADTWYEIEARKLHSKEEKEASMGVVTVEAGSGRRIGGGEWVRFECWFADRLLPSHAYLLQVRVCRERECGPWRSTTVFTPAVPLKPDIQLSNVSSTSVLVEWSVPSSDPAHAPDKFTLELKSPDTDTWHLAYEGPEKSFALRGLLPAHRYRLRLCSKANGDVSGAVEKTVATAVPRKKLILGAARYLIGMMRLFRRRKETEISELRDATDRGLHLFEREGDPHGSGTWITATDRTLSALLLQMVDGSRWSGLQGLVCNPMFMTRAIQELGIDFLQYRVLEQAMIRMGQESTEGTQVPQRRAIGAIMQLLQTQRKRLEEGELLARVIADNLQSLALYKTGSHRDMTIKHIQDAVDPSALVMGAGRHIVDTLLARADEIVKQTTDEARSDDGSGDLMIQVARLQQDLTAVRQAGLAQLCDVRDADVHHDALDAKIAALEEWVAKEGDGAVSKVAERLLSGVSPESQNIMDIARDLSTLMDMQSMLRAGEGKKALLRLQLRVPFYHDQTDKNWQEKMSVMRSRLLSAFTDYTTRVLGIQGMCMRLVRLEPFAQDGDHSPDGVRCLGVVLVSSSRDGQEDAEDGLDRRVAEGLAKGIEEQEERLMSALGDLVDSAEFCTDTRERFLVIGMACSVQTAVVPKKTFRDMLRSDVAQTMGIPASMIRVIKVTPRRTFVVVEIDSGLQAEGLSAEEQEEVSRKVAAATGPWLQDTLTTKDIVSVAVVDASVPPLLPGERTTIKLFNSSTFSDMHGERDFLNSFVFPALRCSCVKRRIDFSWIDFRWGGVTNQENQEGLGVVKCLKKIDECVLRLPHGVNIPVVIGMLGKRAGWIPEEGTLSRTQAEKFFPWLQDDKYKGYSVTGMEMAHAFFRLPYASESFFFIRDHAFMRHKRALAGVPATAQLVFSEARQEAKEFSERLRSQASEHAQGRCFQYKPEWQSPPYHFSTDITLDKIRDLKTELQAGEKRNKAKVFELIRWWLLLKEQLELETASDDPAEESKQAIADNKNNNNNEEEDAEDDGSGSARGKLRQQRIQVLRDAVNDDFIAQLKADVTDVPTHGNQNVAAHGVRFKLPRLGLLVMRALQGMFDAYYPAMAPIQFKHAHLSDRNAQEAVMEEFAGSFCDGTRDSALDDMDATMFGEGAEGVATVATVGVVEGASSCGKTAALARFVFTKSYKMHHEVQAGTPTGATSKTASFRAQQQAMSMRRRRSSVEAVKGWIFAYFFCPLACNLDRVLSYLATEIAVQHRGSNALDDAARTDDNPRMRFEHALAAALQQNKVLLVVDGLGGRDLDRLVKTTLGVYDKAKKERPSVVCRCLLSSDVGELSGWSQSRPQDCKLLRLAALEEQERRDMCKFWMARFGKENLTDSQLDIAVKKKESVLPLYLVLFCAEASLLSLYERVDYELNHMQGTVEEIWINRTLPRLENSFGSEIVRLMMLQLLAYPQGLCLSELKLLMQDHPLLRGNSGASTAVLVERVADALLLFMRPGHSGEADSVLCFNSKVIIAATKRKYAPVAAKEEEQMHATAQSKQGLGTFREHRTAVIECVADKPVDKAPQQPEPTPEADEREFLWRFEVKGQRDLVADKDCVQVRSVSNKDSTISALVAPCIPRDETSYFEVVIQSGGGAQECKVRVGVIIWDDQTSKKVPARMAASSHKLGWLFDCNNGNMQHHSAGNAFVQIQCYQGDRVGLHVLPARGEVRVYVNAKCVGPLPISVHDRRLFRTHDARFVVDLARKDAAVLIARQDRDFKPEAPPDDSDHVALDSE